MARDASSWTKPDRRWVAAVGLFGSLLVGLFAWAMATPVGSSPDEDLHSANIYCIGDSSTCRSDDFAWQGPPTWDPRDSDYIARARQVYPDLWNYGQPRKLPCYVLNGENWYAPDAAVPADCLNSEDPRSNAPASLDDLGYYPNVYYAVMSLFTADTIRQSTVTWRIVNIILALLMAFGSFRLSRSEHRRPLAVAWLVSSVPFGLFLLSSINPSAWAIIGTAALIGPAVALLSDPWERRRSMLRLAFSAICALMAAGSRSEGAFLVAATCLAAFVLAGRLPSRRSHRTGLLLGLGVLLAVAVLVASQSAKIQDVVRTGLHNIFADTATQATSLWDTVLSTPGLYAQAFSPVLGWLEIGMPAAVGVVAGAAFWGAVFFGLGSFSRRKLVALMLLSAVMIAVPAVILLNGQYLQARYFLPLVYVSAATALLPPVRASLPDMSRAQKGLLVFALGIANSLALLQTTVRYVSGLTPGATNPRAFAAHPVPDWWWDYWLSPFANWVLGSVAFALGCFLLLRNPGPLYPRGPIDGPSQSTVEKRPAGADAGPLVATETPDPSPGAAVSSADG